MLHASCAERQQRVEELESSFAEIKSKAESRQADLEQTLTVAEKFWDNLNGVLATLKELQDNMDSADPPGLDPDTIRDEQDVLEVFIHGRKYLVTTHFVLRGQPGSLWTWQSLISTGCN